MKKYFLLYPDIKLVEGIARNTLYLLGDEKTIHLAKEDSILLNAMLKNEYTDVINTFNKDDIMRLQEFLLSNAIGNFYDHPLYSEGYISNRPEFDDLFQSPLIINTLFIQVDRHSNNVYDKTQQNFKHIFQGCNSCLNWKEDAYEKKDCLKDLTLKNIGLLKNITINTAIISGGSPLSDIKFVKRLMDLLHSEHRNIHIEIITPPIEAAIVNQLNGYNISFNISVLVDSIIEELEYTLFMDMLSNIQNKNININLITTSRKEDNYINIKRKISCNFNYEIHTTELLNDDDIIYTMPAGSNRIENTDKTKYFQHQKYHQCLYGKLSIDLNGNIGICPHAIPKLGSLKNNDILEILASNKVTEYWHITKNKIEQCKECENRFACSDCYVMETNNIKSICNYDLKTGIWNYQENEE